MDASKKDEVPMLSAPYLQSDEHNDSQISGVTSRMRSASMSSVMNSMDFSDHENTFIGFTGPLKNERRTSVGQMSGPLYVSHKHDGIFRPAQAASRQKPIESKVERYPSMNGMDCKDRTYENYAGKNEHLLRSGQLGMCNDPYCTTCPTYYNFKAQQKNSRTSDVFDAKVLYFFHQFSSKMISEVFSFGFVDIAFYCIHGHGICHIIMFPHKQAFIVC